MSAVQRLALCGVQLTLWDRTCDHRWHEHLPEELRFIGVDSSFDAGTWQEAAALVIHHTSVAENFISCP